MVIGRGGGCVALYLSLAAPCAPRSTYWAEYRLSSVDDESVYSTSITATLLPSPLLRNPLVRRHIPFLQSTEYIECTRTLSVPHV